METGQSDRGQRAGSRVGVIGEGERQGWDSDSGERTERTLRSFDGEFSQMQRPASPVAAQRPTVHKAQLMPEHPDTQLAAWYPSSLRPLGHLRKIGKQKRKFRMSQAKLG